MSSLEKLIEIQQVMCDLDDRIWNTYFSEQTTDTSSRTLDASYLWLKNDIEEILCEEKLDLNKTVKEITSIVNESGYGNEIFTHFVDMDEILQTVEIRRDFAGALRKVKNGRDLSSKLGWAFNKKDISNLARLHKANKCRRKIEELLTDCNFHYECSKFVNKEYTEFLGY